MNAETNSIQIWLDDRAAPPIRVPIEILAPYLSDYRSPQPFKRLIFEHFGSLGNFAAKIGVARPRLSREVNRKSRVSIRVQNAVRATFPDLTDAELFFMDDVVDPAGRRPLVGA